MEELVFGCAFGAMVGGVVFVVLAVIGWALRANLPPDPPQTAVYAPPPGLGGVGKLRCYHCDCGGRIATAVGLVPTPNHPVCFGCLRPVYGRNLRVTVEDQTRFMESIFGGGDDR